MKTTSETINTTFGPAATFDIALMPMDWQREPTELREALVIQQIRPMISQELERRGRPESALHD